MVEKIIKDLNIKLNMDTKKDDIYYFNDGASGSIVFKIKEKYLVKTLDDIEFKMFIEFFKYYKNDRFQKMVCYNENLLYICFEYIEGDLFRKSKIRNSKEIVKELVDIISDYKEYNNEKYGYLYEESSSWDKFLYDEAYREKNKNIIDYDKLFDSLKIIKKYNCPKYLIHGDFGTHNFIINNKKIKVIDPMPVVGDYLYDFYYAIFTDTLIFKDLTIEYILSFFERDYDYKKALMTICFYIRMNRAIKYDPDDIEIYNEYFKKI